MAVFLRASLFSAAATALASPAWSQTAPSSGSAPTAPASSAPASSVNFSDKDLQKFAAAANELNKIQADAGVAAAYKQPKMLAAVQASGLDPAKFNAIGQAAENDPALQQKIQAAAAKPSPAR